MAETRKIAAILAADVVGFSRMTGADEDRTLARLRALRSDLIDPTIAVHNGRVFKRTGDGALVEFRSVVDAVRCAIEVQDGMVERNAGLPPDRRIDLRIGIHLGDVVEESDCDLMGDGVNIAARLEGICEPGAICLSEDAYRQVRDKIKYKFISLGEKDLKNITRPVTAYSLSVGAQAQPKIGTPAGTEAPGPLSLPDKPSIAVLPFQNMSGDPEQDYFADGIVEDIIAGLSRIKWLFVIARNSSFVYKGKVVDIRLVGRELGVRYVLEGGVRRAGNRLRITAQLIEAESGAHLRADRYDGALGDVFSLQDQITDRVVGIVEPSLHRPEIDRSRRKRRENLDAYDLRLRAASFLRPLTPNGIKTAAGLYEDALKLEPDNAGAHAGIALCYLFFATQMESDGADRSVALQHARAASAKGGDNAMALASAAFVTITLTKDHIAALDAIERALSLNPSSALAHFYAAYVYAYSGNSAAAIVHAERARRLSPFDPMTSLAHHALGIAAIQDGRYDEGALHYAKAVQLNPSIGNNYFGHAVALALAGRVEEATPIARRGLELNPGFRAANIFKGGLAKSIADKVAEGARLLGLPE